RQHAGPSGGRQDLLQRRGELKVVEADPGRTSRDLDRRLGPCAVGEQEASGKHENGRGEPHGPLPGDCKAIAIPVDQVLYDVRGPRGGSETAGGGRRGGGPPPRLPPSPP